VEGISPDIRRGRSARPVHHSIGEVFGVSSRRRYQKGAGGGNRRLLSICTLRRCKADGRHQIHTTNHNEDSNIATEAAAKYMCVRDVKRSEGLIRGRPRSRLEAETNFSQSTKDPRTGSWPLTVWVVIMVKITGSLQGIGSAVENGQNKNANF
jgi:hypothetical protein